MNCMYAHVTPQCHSHFFVCSLCSFNNTLLSLSPPSSLSPFLSLFLLFSSLALLPSLSLFFSSFPIFLSQTFVYMIVEVCSASSTAIIILLSAACTFWLIFFKVSCLLASFTNCTNDGATSISPPHLLGFSQAQSTLFLSLPVGSQLLVFQVLLGTALLFRVRTHMKIDYIIHL